MAAPDDDDEDPVPDDPETRFLNALWGCLEDAYRLSIGPGVINDLSEVQGLCEQAVTLIRAYQGASSR